MFSEQDVDRELKAALSELLQDIVPPGMDRELSVVGEEALVSDEVREQLFLVLREALRNTVSHSGASKVTTTVVVDQAKIAGVVEDNGQGFDRKTTDPAESGGLAYMADRTSLLGGACSMTCSDAARGAWIGVSRSSAGLGGSACSWPLRLPSTM